MSGQHKLSSTTSQATADPPPLETNPITGEPLPEGFTAVFEPNNFIYNDNKGIRHNIYLPRGTYSKAMKCYEAKKWDELAKYPAWGMNSYML